MDASEYAVFLKENGYMNEDYLSWEADQDYGTEPDTIPTITDEIAFSDTSDEIPF